MRGQIKIDFVFGVIVFSVIIFFIVSQTNTLFSSLLTDSKSDALKARATSAIDILVEDPGDPANWDSAGGVKRIGLASSPYVLSRAKVLNLSYNCSNSDLYKNLLWNFDMKAYRLRIYNSTKQIMLCGFDSLEAPTVTETRYVMIDNEYGRVVLDLW